MGLVGAASGNEFYEIRVGGVKTLEQRDCVFELIANTVHSIHHYAVIVSIMNVEVAVLFRVDG